MSGQALGKIADKILKDLKSTVQGSDKDARSALERQVGQVLIINKVRFSQILKESIPSLKNPKAKPVLEKIWSEFSEKLKTRQSNIPKKRLKEIIEQVGPNGKNIPGLRTNDHVFFIKTYATAKSAKGRLLKAIVRKQLKENSISFQDEEVQRLGGADNKFGAQLGHAEGGFGIATSSTRVAQAKRVLSSSSLSSIEKATIQTAISQYENTLKLDINHTQVVTRKGIKKSYVPVLSWQKAINNNLQAKLERQALTSFKNELASIKTKSSTPLDEAVAAVLLNELAPRKAKVTGKRKKSISETSKSPTRKTRVKQKNYIKVARDSTVPQELTGPKRKAKKGPSSVPLSFLGILNSRLPETVAKNMGEPGLVYRTGRFANSVKALNILTTKQGFSSIGYTYDLSPYQVFEMGQGSPPWATPERDPRGLIDRSIREIAAQYAMGRFYTRRL